MAERELARQWVTDCITAILPPDVPTFILEIVGARFTGKNSVKAEVKLFDGLPGTIEIGKSHAGAWRTQWLELPGGAANWNGKAWVRVQGKVCQVELPGLEKVA